MKKYQLIDNCKIGKNATIYQFVNLYGCTIGNDCKIGAFVEIQKGVEIGDRVKVQSHTFICEGVHVANDVFIGHSVVFINDKYPRSSNASGKLQTQKDWDLLYTVVEQSVSIGSNVTILGGITIGANAIVGAGSVVTKNVAANTVVVGNPAKVIRTMK